MDRNAPGNHGATDFFKSFMYLAIGVSALSLTILPLVSLFQDDSPNSALGDSAGAPGPERGWDDRLELEARLREATFELQTLRKEQRAHEKVLLDKVETLTLERESLRGEAESLAAEKSALGKRLEELRATHRQEASRLEQEVEALQAEAEQVEAARARLQQELTSAQQELATAREKLASLEDSRSSLRSTTDDQASQLEKLQTEFASLKTTHDDLAASHKSQEEALAEATARVEDLTSRLEEGTAQITSLQQEKATLATQVQELTAARDDLSQQVQSLTTERDDLASKVTALQTDKATLAEELAAARKELERGGPSGEKIQQTIAALRDTLQSLDSKIERGVADLQSRLSDVKGRDAATRQLADEIAALAGRLEQLSSELSEKELLVEKFRLQRELLMIELRRLDPDNAKLKVIEAERAAEKGAPGNGGASGVTATNPQRTSPETPPAEEDVRQVPASVAGIDLSHGLVVVDRGLDDGLVKGLRFWIYIDEQPVAQVEVARVQRGLAGCTVLSASDLDALERGTNVTLRLPAK